MEPATQTAKTNDKPTSTAYIPHTQTTHGRLSRMLTKQNIKALLYNLEKYSTTFHQSRMHWD
jgi:molecular chaperone GrpE (heat shock protein)